MSEITEPVQDKPFPIDAIRKRIEACDREKFLYDARATMHADRVSTVAFKKASEWAAQVLDDDKD